MHHLLSRQLSRYFGGDFQPPLGWREFLAAVSDVYKDFDVHREVVERSLVLNSQELHTANAQMRAIFQAIPDLLFRVDEKGTILDFQSGTTGDLLIPRGELIGKRIQNIPVKPLAGQFSRAIEQVLSQRQLVNLEYALTLKGTQFYYEARFVPLPENQIVVIVQNITGRKRSEEQLKQMDERFRYVALATRDAIYDWDVPADYVWRSDAFQALFSPNEPVGTDPGWWKARVHPEDLPRVLRSWDEASNAQSRSWSGEYRLRRADGSYATVIDRGYIVYDSAGKPIRKIGAMTDISERKLAEEDLFNSRQMLRTVLDTIPQRVFWKDRNSVYVGCNKPLALDCGYSDPAELIGKSDYQTVSAATADLYRQDDQRVMETRQAKLNYEERQIKGDGSVGWLKTSKVPLYDISGNVIGVLGTYEDVSERRQLEDQLRQSQKMEAFGQLAAGVAHDFNNILTVIQGNADILHRRNLTEAEQANALSGVSEAVGRAANLTRQLLTFSRRQLLQPQPLDLNEVVANMTKMLQRLIGEHIALEAHYAPGGAPVHADLGMMEQVIMNLAVNSRDAMPKGGTLVIQTSAAMLNETTVFAKHDIHRGEFIRLTVTDTGCGIPAEYIPHVFEPFFTTKEVGKGTGLGLATVFGIVEQHHGWIEVESKLGAGTTFHVYLPRLKEAITVRDDPLELPQVRGGSEVILLVEDETAVRELLKRVLDLNGYCVYEAPSGTEALQVWRQHRSDIRLLVTDMVMPGGINGRELANKLLAEKPDLKVIYCSGYTDDFINEDSPLRDNANFLEKPFVPNEFLRRVRSCLDGG